MKDQAGTIETLSRQLVQAGIKGKVMQADMEITKKKESVKANMNKEYIETEGKQKLLRNTMQGNANLEQSRMSDQEALKEARMQDELENYKKGLDNTQENQ